MTFHKEENDFLLHRFVKMTQAGKISCFLFEFPRPMMPVSHRPRLSAYSDTVRRALFPPLIALFLLIMLLLWLVSTLSSAARSVQHTDEVIAHSHRIMRLMIDAETGERGYLVGGKTLFLAPFTEAQNKLPTAFDELAALVADSPPQSARIERLRSAYAQWKSNAQQEMRLRRAGNPQWLTNFDQGGNKTLMDGIRRQVDDVITAEELLRQQKQTKVRNLTRNSLAVGGIATLLFGGFLAFGTRRQMEALSNQYETALGDEQEQRDRFFATLTSIGDGVMVTDAHGIVTLMNPICEKLTGWTEAEARGKNAHVVFDIVHESERTPVQSPIEEVLRTGEIVLLANHTALKRRDGTEVLIEDSAAPIRDLSGTITGVVLVFRDVTERKAQEAELQAAADALAQSEARFRTMADVMPQMVWATDPKGAHLYYNHRWYEYTGQTVEESLGFGFALALHPDDTERTLAKWQRAWEHGEPYDIEYRFRHEDGSYRWFVGRAAPVRSPETNETVMWVGTCTDVDDLKRAQEEITALSERNERIAETLQRSMLVAPVVDRFSGVEIVTDYEAAWDEAQVGGDFFDTFGLENNKVALIVGDATGKGLEAAAHTAEVKYALRAFLRENSHPANALERLNEMLVVSQQFEEDPKNAYVAVAVTVFDTQSGEGICACAGAEPPLVFRASDAMRAEEIAAIGALAGVEAQTSYNSATFTLSSGDLFVMTTDGITEARNPANRRRFFGTEGLVAAIQHLSQTVLLPETAKGVTTHAKAFAGGKLHDDVCVLLLRRR